MPTRMGDLKQELQRYNATVSHPSKAALREGGADRSLSGKGEKA